MTRSDPAIPPTPGPQDVPGPVPAPMGLAGEAQPDITRYLNVRRAGSGTLAPDGTRLAFATSITGVPQLWTMAAEGGWPHQLTFGEDGITILQWSPRGDWIVYGADRGGNERLAFYLIRPDGREERELLPPSDEFRVFGGFSPDGSRVAFATTVEGGDRFDIHLVEVESGRERRVLEGRMGLYIVAWHPAGTHLVLSERIGEDANRLHLLDLASGHLETLFDPPEPSSYDSVSWRPDGEGFYLVTDEGRDLAALAYYDLESRDLRLVETPPHDVEQVTLSRDGRYLGWTTNEGGYGGLHVRDLASDRMVDDPELPPALYTLRWAADAPVAVVSVLGPQVPGDLWIWKVTTDELERVTFSSTAGLDVARFVVPEAIDFPARDGETLHGLLYLPAGSAKPPPLLLGVHGGPTAQARPIFNPVHQYLLARGIAILDLNFRGSTGYGKRYARLDNQRLRPNAVRDMEDALDYLAQDGRVDAERAAVMGGSYGGFMTFAALVHFPDRFAGGVSFVGVSNWVTALERASPQLKASDRLEYGDIDDPEDRAFFRELSPITYVDRLRAPLMVVHGANDPRDPVDESDQFVRAIRERGGEVEYLRFPDEGHGVRKLPNRIITYRRVATFLERILGLG